MDALKNATFLADNEDSNSTEEEIRNHFLDHSTQPEEENNQVTVMAFQHKSLPIWGVQFHPESVSTENGSKMMMNFQKETYHWMMTKVEQVRI
jgi:para-aminobenzoate synthetase